MYFQLAISCQAGNYSNNISVNKVVPVFLEQVSGSEAGRGSLGPFSSCCRCRIAARGPTESVYLKCKSSRSPVQLRARLWRVVRAERASSSWPALMANLKSSRSTVERRVTILNYRYLFPQLCLGVMNGSNLALVWKFSIKFMRYSKWI